MPLTFHPSPLPLCSRPPTQGRRLAARAQVGWLPVSDHQGCGRVRFYSRHGAEYTDRLPGMVEAFAKLPAQSAILDGDLCLIDPRLMAQMRTSRPDERQLMFLVFDLLHQDGVDLRGLPLSERKRDLRRLCRKSPVPFMREVQTFPNGNTLLFDHCNKFGFEGVVSKPSGLMRAGQAATGSRQSARAGSASTRAA